MWAWTRGAAPPGIASLVAAVEGRVRPDGTAPVRDRRVRIGAHPLGVRTSRRRASGGDSPGSASDRIGTIPCDTPPGLKTGGFSERAPSYERERLARVGASTHQPQIMRHTILDY